jgi:hypothetical protein
MCGFVCKPNGMLALLSSTGFDDATARPYIFKHVLKQEHTLAIIYSLSVPVQTGIKLV